MRKILEPHPVLHHNLYPSYQMDISMLDLQVCWRSSGTQWKDACLDTSHITDWWVLSSQEDLDTPPF